MGARMLEESDVELAENSGWERAREEASELELKFSQCVAVTGRSLGTVRWRQSLKEAGEFEAEGKEWFLNGSKEQGELLPTSWYSTVRGKI